ncbi:SpoIIE family protein phosphatase [Flindersiella endophytica]
MLADLQRALLPAAVPVLSRADVGATYLLPADEASAGGDWFEAIALNDGELALVVGDVVGHGVAASVTMGRLRAVLSERLLAGMRPAAALSELDTFAAKVEGGEGTTVCVAVLDPATGAVSYSSAGHPPPLLVSAGGEVSRFLAPSRGGPLASGSRYIELTATLAEGELLLLYTDGIVERPGVPPSRGMVELAQAAADSAVTRVPSGGRLSGPRPSRQGSDAQRVCDQTLELLVGASGYRDDVTLLAARRRGRRPSLELTLPNADDAPAAARRALGEWLGELGLDGTLLAAVQQAVTELVVNAIEHAYVDEPEASQVIGVTGSLTDQSSVLVAVSDSGRWRRPRTDDSSGGLGLAVAGSFADQMHIDRGEAGTTVRLVHAVRHEVRLLASGDAPRTPAGQQAADYGEPFATELAAEEAGARLIVRGVVDTTNAGQLDHLLRTATLGGTTSRAVDLSGVTLLASAGVRVLYAAHRRCLQHAQRLDLIAPAGSTAQHVLALAALPYT